MTTQELEPIKERHNLVLERTGTVPAAFVETRLAIGFAFAHLFALHRANHNSEKALESRRRAQEALKIALKFMKRARVTDSKLKEVTEQVIALEKLLYLS
jgi:hypothetical protein